MKAVILAAGKGQRLEPLTRRRPKPMLPIVNRPLLEYVVEAVVEAGVDEIVLVVGYKRDRIQTHFGDGDDWNAEITYAIQEKQLGTGHAVLQAESHVDDEFLVVNGDRILDSGVIGALVEAERDTGTATIAVTRSETPSEYGVVTLSGDRVTDLTEKPRPSVLPSEIINAGVYAFDASIFDVIRNADRDDDGELALTGALATLVDRGDVRAVRHDGIWIDASYLWDVPRITSDVLDRRGGRVEGAVDERAAVESPVAIGENSRVRPNATVLGGTSIGPNVTVGPNAVLSNAVVLADATIESGAVLHNCVVGENARVGAAVTVPDGVANVRVDGSLHQDVRFGGAVGDNARVGASSVLRPGTVVGDGATVDPGSALSGRIEDGAEVRRG